MLADRISAAIVSIGASPYSSMIFSPKFISRQFLGRQLSGNEAHKPVVADHARVDVVAINPSHGPTFVQRFADLSPLSRKLDPTRTRVGMGLFSHCSALHSLAKSTLFPSPVASPTPAWCNRCHHPAGSGSAYLRTVVRFDQHQQSAVATLEIQQ
jgi:hypothetical protein